MVMSLKLTYILYFDSREGEEGNIWFPFKTHEKGKGYIATQIGQPKETIGTVNRTYSSRTSQKRPWVGVSRVGSGRAWPFVLIIFPYNVDRIALGFVYAGNSYRV